MAKMSFSAYAKHRGVSPAAVTRAVQTGRIPVEKDPATGRRIIDAAEADAAWAANRDEAKAVGARAAQVARTGDQEDRGGPPIDDEEGGGDGITAASYSLSRARREAFNAELARLKLEQLRGSLVPAADVRKASFDAARVVRESLLNIPDRLAAPLAGETEAARVHELLKAELVRALEALADGL